VSRGVSPRAVRASALVLVVVVALLAGVAVAPVGVAAAQTGIMGPPSAALCGFDGDPSPAAASQRHDFGEVVVSRTATRTAAVWTDVGGVDPTVAVGGPDAGQFRARVASGSATADDRTLQLSFAPTTPGAKRAWAVVERGDARDVHCLVGTAVVAGASRGGGAGDGTGPNGRATGGAAAVDGASGGGKVTDAVRGFGREFVDSVTRGVVSVVTLEFARDAAVGAGAAWAAGDGLAGKLLGVAGYTLSGVDPTAGVRKGIPAALAAWRVGDFEGAGRALFGVVESVVFTGAAAAGAWEGSKRARQFAQDRRDATPAQVAGVDRSPAPSAAVYRAFSDGIDAALAGALGTPDDSGTAVRGEGDPGVVADGTEGAGTMEDTRTGGVDPTEADVPSDRDDRRELA
jgi:hypothetical protein